MDISFSDFLAASSADVQEAPEGVQWYRYQEFIEMNLEEYMQDQNRSRSQARCDFADYFIGQFLGDDWFEEHVRSYRGRNDDERALRHYRWRLGSLVFQFQGLPWFEALVGNLKRRDLPGALFEAEVARILMHIPGKVTLRTPIGKKGEDFDIEYGGQRFSLAVEAKAKQEDTSFSQKTVTNTLESARRQLPKEGAGLIFLRSPSAWSERRQFPQEIKPLVERFLSRTSRVQAVILVWDEAAYEHDRIHFETRTLILRRSDIDEKVAELLHLLEEARRLGVDVHGPISVI